MKNIDKYKNDLIDLIIDRLAATKANGVCDCQYTRRDNLQRDEIKQRIHVKRVRAI